MKTHTLKLERLDTALTNCVPVRVSGILLDLAPYRRGWKIHRWVIRFATKFWTTPRTGLMLRNHKERMDFLDWCLTSKNLRRLIVAWIKSKYNPCLTPSLDHVRPLCLGGQHKLSNFQWLALRDNLSKGGRLQPVSRQIPLRCRKLQTSAAAHAKQS